jgi:hypothetical protein
VRLTGSSFGKWNQEMIYKILQIAVPFIWFGLLGGISFLEAPLKFQAPNITLALGLEIGKLVFFALNKIEIILAILLFISFFKVRAKNKFALMYFAAILILLILQTVWLLPVLNARADAVIDGTSAPYSNTHIIYIVFETAKFLLLFVLGVNLTKNHLKIE